MPDSASDGSISQLANILQPASIAILGASERNHYAAIAVNNLRSLGYAGKLFMVNPRGGEIFGQQAFTSCAAIGEPADTAYVCVPLAAVLDAVREAAQAGVRSFVVLSSGFAEVGAEGAKLQAKLMEICHEYGARVLGPNCLGFVNYVDSVALGSIPVSLPQPAGRLAIVSGSGATSSLLARLANQLGAGVTYVVATGNEADVTTADCLHYLLDQPSVGAIAVFLESVRDPQTFIAAAELAIERRKPIVVLKVGASPVTAAVAAAHTGALVGDDKVFDAVCERLAIVRVTSFEQLVSTAVTLGTYGVLEQDGVAAVSISGGACEVMSDLAHQFDVPMRAFAPETVAALSEVISHLGQTHNPIDLTGAAVPDPTLWEKAMRIVARDPQMGVVLCNFDVPASATMSMPAMYEQIALGLHAAAPKSSLVSTFFGPINEHGQHWLDENQLAPPLPGLAEGMHTIGRLIWWSRRVRAHAPYLAARPAKSTSSERPRSEFETLDYLRRNGVPVIPMTLATSEAETVAAARALGGPVVLKIASPDIAHKTDIGGVRLNLQGEAAVAAAYVDILARARAAKPDAKLEGVLVSPMREKGVELFVGLTRDPEWGLVMAVGLGGVWVEVMQDVRLLLLPARPEDVTKALESLRGAKLLQGYRGAPAADLKAVGEAVARLADAALALGDDLAAFEINPLLVRGDVVEAIDALPVWSA